MTLYNHSSSNKRKTYLLLFFFIVFVGLIGYGLSVLFDSVVILYVAIIISIVSSFFSYWFSDKMVLRVSNAKKLSFEDNKEIYRLVENLCLSSGLPLPAIYIINDPAPNAFATGRNPKNAVVALTTGLIQMLDKSELEGVIAHELSHIKNYDILLASLITVLLGTVVMISDMLSRSLLYRNTSRDNNDKRGGIFIILLAVLFSILAPLFATLIQLAISRKREFLADADGALMTRYPEGLASALEKISRDPRPVKAVNQATAHLYISNPLKGKRKGFWSKAFMTHPLTEDRIKALKALDV